MNKKLFIVATPIGNISEINQRAILVFQKCHNFFCEDTRISKKLFNCLNISTNNKNFYSLNAFNEKKIIDSFDFSSENYCLLSDAGYPLVSDPGYLLVNFFIEKKWDIQVINGPSSLMHALVISGFKTTPFLFYGFLNHHKNIKLKELNDLKNELKTIVIFESVHRIKETLSMIKKTFFSYQRICIARELTKLNETIYRTTISDIDQIKITEKGEFVIVIDNHLNKKNPFLEQSENYDLYFVELESLIKKGERTKDACKMIAYKYNLNTKKLYNFWQQQKN